MLPHHLEITNGSDGLPVVEVTFDLTAVQIGAAAHAMRVMREVRFRTAEMSGDDVVAMREMTSIVDELTELEVHSASVRLRTSIARLGSLRDGIEEFVAGEHIEREGDADARPAAFGLADALAELHREAVSAALDGGSAVVAPR